MGTDTRHPEARRSGFTLVEIMVVIAIIGILAALIVPNVMKHWEEARVEAARIDVGQIDDAIKTFYMREMRLPTLEDLIEPPPELQGHTEVPRDPWLNPYVVRESDTAGAWEVLSLGPDGLEDTEDDISSRGLKDRAR